MVVMTAVESQIGPYSARLVALCRRLRVRKLDVFGSATRTSEARDLDFLVEFESLPPADYADAWFTLREELERLFGKPIDLISSQAVENPYFAESISQSRATVFAA